MRTRAEMDEATKVAFSFNRTLGQFSSDVAPAVRIRSLIHSAPKMPVVHVILF